MTTSGNTLRFACQTYSWQMSIDRYQGKVEHMAGIAAAAGFTGFEPETIMLEKDWTASGLRLALDGSRLQLAALCLVDEWRRPAETAEERRHADRVIDAVAAFPGAIINLVHYPGVDRSDLAERQANALSCMAAIAERAAERGIACSFHPNSPPGSVFRVAEDYELLLAELHPLIGYTPDTGHIAAGGMDPLSVVKQHRDRVKYIHVKDRFAEGGWAPTGEGAVDIAGIVDHLVATGYDGWITFEDESPLAEADPDAAVMNAGRYVAEKLMPAYAAAVEA
jgi:inosose dehydratase